MGRCAGAAPSCYRDPVLSFSVAGSMMTETTDVVVVGAGPAGLAVGACLRKAGLDFVMLERSSTVGSSWRAHYERLHLHTIKRLSALPDLPFPDDYPRYVPRKLMIDYLDRYAQAFALAPRFNETVHGVRRHGLGWVVESDESTIGAAHVVIASGLNAEPVMPAMPGFEMFRGQVLHSANYVNAAPFSGQSVLVVGMGNTGAEIALDLSEGGARPTLSLRGGVHIVPRDLFGVPIQVVATAATRVLPLRLNDAMFPFILDLALGNLKPYGIRRPTHGLLQQVASAGKIPVLDVGTVRKIAAGAIRVAPGIAAIQPDGVQFQGGRREAFDAIIFATGFRPNYADFLVAGDAAACAEVARSAAQTLHFVGFRNPVTGLLRQIAKEAVATADAIARARAG